MIAAIQGTISPPARGAEKFDAALMARTLAPYVEGETIGVVHIDVSRASPAPAVAMIARIVPDAAAELAETEKGIDGCLAALRRERVSDVYFVVSLGGPSMVPRMSLVLSPPEANRDLVRLRKDLSLRPEVELHSAAVASPENDRPARPELAEALAAAGDAAVQVVLMPPASSRRVIEELMPQFPKEIGGGPSTVLTHGISWAALAVDLSPAPAARLTIKSQDSASAEALRTKWLDLLKLAAQQKEVREVAPEFDKVVALLTPKLSGDRLSLAIDEKDVASAGMMVQLERALEKRREAAQRLQSINNLKQIGLALWTYYDSAKHFPPPATHTPDGKPLLSWRVAILPYTEHVQLYKQFHLDEAWDSPHNKALIEKMPSVFRSARSKAAKGMTNYLVPVGGGAVYSSMKDEPKINDITDGTSHTLMVVEVDDEHAVPWTKPEDLSFSPQDPKKGIGSLFEQGFCASFCDGSAHFLRKSIDRETLKALFTRAAGDPFDASKL